MNLILDCYPCMLRQALSMAHLLNLDKTRSKSIVDFTLHTLLDMSQNTSPQQVIVGIADHLKEIHSPSTIFDPYKELKQ